MIAAAAPFPGLGSVAEHAKPSCTAAPLVADRAVQDSGGLGFAPRGPAGMQEDFTQPRRPQSQGGPSGSTMMWPISPAFPDVPRTTSSLRTMPQPMPVPMYMKMKLPAPLGPPAQVSATAALVTSLSTRTE